MNFFGQRGIRFPKFLTNEQLRGEDLAYLHQALYQDITETLANIFEGLVSDDLSSKAIVTGGLTIAHTSGLSFNVTAGRAVSYTGSYWDSGLNWGFQASPGDSFSVTLTEDRLLAVNPGNATHPRIDIVEIRPVQTEFDSQSRDFRDPLTETISSLSVTTKISYEHEIRVTAGTPAASPVAPAVSAGWIKIGEIDVAALASSITDADIHSVSESDAWTTDIGSTVSGSYGTYSLFLTAITSGVTDNSFLSNVGKYLYDDLYIKSEDGGYAADELIAYKDATGRIAKTTNGKLSRIADGYAGTDDNLFPSEDNIGDITTDFPAGQGGTSGGSLMQQLGYKIEQNGLRLPKLVGKNLGYNIVQEGFASSLSFTSGQWLIVALNAAGGSFTSFDMTIMYNFSSDTLGFGAFRVTGRIIAGTTFNIKFTPLSNVQSSNIYTGRVRIITSNDATERGSYLMIEILNTVTANVSILGIMNSYSKGWTIPTPTIWNGTTLPDGSSYATYGQASDDWWRFGAGETVLWSGSQVVAAGGSYSWTSPLFTGFTNQMFKSYRIYYDNLYESNYIDICGPRISSQIGLSPLYFLDNSIPLSGDWYWVSGVIRTDTYSDDFTFYSHSNKSITVYKIVGISLI